MVRGTLRQTANRWDAPEGRAHWVITYLVGTVGVAIVLTLGVIAAQQAGWLNNVESALRQIGLPGLPRAPHTELDELVQGLTGKVGNVEHSTSALWQRGSQAPRQLSQGGSPSADRRK
jgi:hypothetical protein